jgi:hypothetical protein
MFRTIRLLVPGIALVAMLAACTGAGAAPSVASLDDPGASSSPAASSAPTDPQEAFLAYAQCMRDHDIDMPDPEMVESDEGGGKTGTAFRVGVGGPEGGVDKEKFRAADTACRHFIANVVNEGGRGGLSPEDEEKLLAFTRCMREHGIDLPDPGTGGVIIDEEQGGSGPKIDPNDPDFEAAQEACGSLLPGKMQVSGGSGTGPSTNVQPEPSK